jgi:hypothetical protein
MDMSSPLNQFKALLLARGTYESDRRRAQEHRSETWVPPAITKEYNEYLHSKLALGVEEHGVLEICWRLTDEFCEIAGEECVPVVFGKRGPMVIATPMLPMLPELLGRGLWLLGFCTIIDEALTINRVIPLPLWGEQTSHVADLMKKALLL